nr:hypothetical protein [uncultured Capnocytophaga sp.]
MEVNIKQALKIFFSKSSFEMIYFEALANALDADATEFNIDISLGDYKELSNLLVTLSDNGVGFDDVRFRKFSKLLDVEEQSHKGLGRLVYLCYFDKVQIQSVFDNSKQRVFEFSETFNKECEVKNIPKGANGSIFKMSGFIGSKLGKNDYISPSYIKRVLLENFYAKFYKAKLNGKKIIVNIKTTVGNTTKEEVINTEELPKFEVRTIEDKMDFFDKIELYYNIREVTKKEECTIITALAIDERSYKIDIIAEENLPSNYEMIFLLMLESLQGKVDGARLNLSISEQELATVKMIFRNAIAEVIRVQFPQIEESNQKKEEYLNDTYPHLAGYFEKNEIGYASQSDVLKKAQDKFFRDQREILTAKELSEEQFQKSLDLSARALAEYILFRQNVIKKLRMFNVGNKEADIHNLIAQKSSEFNQDNIVVDLYKNNVWLLDDKFMSYYKVLSEAKMSKVIDIITQGEIKDNDNDRPDITLFFSDNPEDENRKVDVVVAELKRLGATAEQNSIVEFQLETRTQRLATYYQNRIQRMWFYGIVDFDDKYRMHLINNGFSPLFSKGEIYFRSKPVYLDPNKEQSVIQNAYILDFKAMVEDADSRNLTFLKILRERFENNQIKKIL